MKKFLSILFATILAGQAWAQTTFEIGNLKYTVIDEENLYVSVEKGTTEPTNGLEIPTKVIDPEDNETYTVTSIPANAFNGCSGLISVVVPNSVTTIGSAAFGGCSSLESITLPFVGDKPHTPTDTCQYPFGYIFGIDYYAGGTRTSQYYHVSSSSTSGVRSSYIPTSLKEVVITGSTYIQYGAFHNCSGLTFISIPESVTSIGSSAFYNCSGLTSITIPNSVNTIGSAVFRGCTSLESITLPFVGEKLCGPDDKFQYPFGYIFGTVSYDGGIETTQSSYYGSSTRVTTRTFYIPESLKTVTITGGNILFGAFNNCIGLTSITIPSTVIGERAFCGCSGLTSVTIPDSVTSIGSSAFQGCSSLSSLTIPNSVISIGIDLFNNCDKLEYNQYNNALYLGNEDNPYLLLVKVDSNDITSCVINNNCKFICSGAFSNCNGLTSVAIPNSVTSIGNYAFENCNGLKSVIIPNSVTKVGYRAFVGCWGVYCEAKSKPGGWSNIDAGTHVYWGVRAKNTNDFVYNVINDIVTPYQLEAYKYIGDSISANIPSSVTIDGKDYEIVSIAKDAFKGYDNLDYTAFGNAYYIGNEENPYLILITAKNKKIESCEINSKCRFIYDEAFSGCTNLTEITIPESIIGIGDNAFNGAGLQKSKFASISQICCLRFANIYSNPLTLTHHLYIDTAEVTNLVVPDSVRNIGQYAFYGCNGLAAVTIGKFIEGISDYAFYGCNNLSLVTIGNSVKSIGNYVFFDCSKLSSVNIGNSVEDIGDWAFSGCNGLTSITIPSSVRKIGQRAFNNVNNLHKAEFASVESLCGISFGNNTANPLYYAHILYINGERIINLVIPETVKSIGAYAFNNCTSIASLTISDSVTIIGGQAFYGCSRLASIDIPNSVYFIEGSAFGGCLYLKSLSYNSNAIGAHFNNISALKSIFIGDSIKAISGSEFNGCDNLVNVISMAAVPPTLNGDPYTFADTIWVPAASVEAYQNAPVWKRKEIMPLDYYTVKTSTANAERGTVSTGGQYAAMQAVTVYATPTENFHFKAWSDGNTENPRTIMIDGDVNVTAVFEGDSRTVNVSANSSAFGSAVSAESYHYGDTVTFTATPAVGYHFVGWSDSVTTNPRVWVVTEDSSFNAVFEINRYAIAATAAANGSVEGDSTYNHGTTAVLNAIANVGYHFIKWSDDVTDNPRSVTATSDSAFTAVFEINTYTIAASAENGSVSGADTYNYGSTATLTATPAEGYHFVKWSDGSTDATRTIVVTGDLQFTAEFAIDTHTVTATAENGSVTGTDTYDYGTEATITATPAVGYHFVKWSDGNTDATRKITVTGDIQLTAIFEKNEEQGGNENQGGNNEGNENQGGNNEGNENQGGNNEGNENQGGNNEGNENQGGNNEGNENQGGNNEGNENQGGENTNPGTAVAESVANAINIYAHGNTIIVENATEEIRVYDAMGRLIGRDAINRVRTEIRVNGTGLYIVKVGNVAKRVMVN